jgi:hypothetical protein
MSALAPKAKYPSFKFAVPGDEFDVIVTQPTEDRQAREFGKDTLKWWDPETKTQPVMQTKVVGRAADGIEYAIYAEGRMARAITKALIAASEDDIEEGARLRVKFTHYGEGKNPAMPPKEYEAHYTAPQPQSSRDDDEPPF